MLPSLAVPPHVVPWLPLGSVALHLIEEFAWPGGFGDWYRAYRPERAASVTRGFLVRINVLFVLLAFSAGFDWPTSLGVALWLTTAAIGAANAAFHVYATWRGRRYSPGVVTGVLCYVPLALWGFPTFVAQGRVSIGTAVLVALVGPGYHLYAAANHRRRARAMARAR